MTKFSLMNAVTVNLFLAVVLLSGISFSQSQADEPEATARIWRSADFKFSVKAKLVDFDGTTASLEEESGNVLKVPFEKLSVRDRKFLESLNAEPEPMVEPGDMPIPTNQPPVTTSGAPLPPPAPVVTLESPAYVKALAFGRDGKTLYSSHGWITESKKSDGRVVAWDVAEGKELHRYAHNAIDLNQLYVPEANPQSLVGMSERGDFVSWDIAKPDSAETELKLEDRPTMLSLTPDGKHVLYGKGKDLLMAATDKFEEPIKTFVGLKSYPFSAAISSDGNTVLGVGIKVTIWNSEGEAVQNIDPRSNRYVSASQQNNKLAHSAIAESGGMMVKILDGSNLAVQSQLLLPQDFQQRSQSLSPDGGYMAVASTSGEVCVFNCKTGQHLTTLPGNGAEELDEQYVDATAFSQDNRWLAVGDGLGTTRIYSMAAIDKNAKFTPLKSNEDQEPAEPEPEPAEPVARVWKSADGKFSIKATLLKYDGTIASLQTEDKVIQVPVNKLSAEDQKFLESVQ